MAESKIKTVADAFKATNRDPKCLPDVSMLPKKDGKMIINHFKLMVVREALNGDWIPDWMDSDQQKWYPWFYMNSGSGVSFLVCYCVNAGSTVGSRLCYKTEAIAKYAAIQFKSLYDEYFILNK